MGTPEGKHSKSRSYSRDHRWDGSDTAHPPKDCPRNQSCTRPTDRLCPPNNGSLKRERVAVSNCYPHDQSNVRSGLILRIRKMDASRLSFGRIVCDEDNRVPLSGDRGARIDLSHEGLSINGRQVREVIATPRIKHSIHRPLSVRSHVYWLRTVSRETAVGTPRPHRGNWTLPQLFRPTQKPCMSEEKTMYRVRRSPSQDSKLRHESSPCNIIQSDSTAIKPVFRIYASPRTWECNDTKTRLSWSCTQTACLSATIASLPMLRFATRTAHGIEGSLSTIAEAIQPSSGPR